MMFNWFILLIAVAAGAMMPIQAGVNSQLSRYLSHPFQAAFISFLGGVIVMTVCCLLSGKYFPSISKVLQVPPYLLIGGFLGAILVVTSIILAPKLGATVLISCLIAGQLLTSIIVDHFGWVGFPVHPVSPLRILGICMLVGGVLLVKLF